MPMQTAEVALTCERANIDGVQTPEADTDGSFERIDKLSMRGNEALCCHASRRFYWLL